MDTVEHPDGAERVAGESPAVDPKLHVRRQRGVLDVKDHWRKRIIGGDGSGARTIEHPCRGGVQIGNPERRAPGGNPVTAGNDVNVPGVTGARGRTGQIAGKTISALIGRVRAMMPQAECHRTFLNYRNLLDAGRRKHASPKLQFLTFAMAREIQQGGYFDRQRLVQGRFDRERKLMTGASRWMARRVWRFKRDIVSRYSRRVADVGPH